MTPTSPNSPAALRAKIAEATREKAPPIPVVAAKPSAKEAPPTLTYLCKHTRPVADITHAVCPACRDANRKAKAEKRRKKREATLAAQMVAGAPVLGKAEDSGRLPDGATFQVAYSSERHIWTGTLAALGRTYAGEASGVEKLLRRLAEQFRADTTPAEAKE